MREEVVTAHNYGFAWGPMIVERSCHVRGYYVLTVRTDLEEVVELYVTERGKKIRVVPKTDGVKWEGS